MRSFCGRAHIQTTQNRHIARRTGQDRWRGQGRTGERHVNNRVECDNDANRYFSRSISILVIYSMLLSYPGVSRQPTTNRPQDADRPRLESIASGGMSCCRRRPASNRNTVALSRWEPRWTVRSRTPLPTRTLLGMSHLFFLSCILYYGRLALAELHSYRRLTMCFWLFFLIAMPMWLWKISRRSILFRIHLSWPFLLPTRPTCSLMTVRLT